MKQFFSISNKDWFESTAPDQDILLLVIYLNGDDLGLNLSFSQGKKISLITQLCVFIL